MTGKGVHDSGSIPVTCTDVSLSRNVKIIVHSDLLSMLKICGVYNATLPNIFTASSLGTTLSLDEISGLQGMKNEVMIFWITASCSFEGG